MPKLTAIELENFQTVSKHVVIPIRDLTLMFGPNGAGKSTILKALFGLAPIHSGNIFWHEEKIVPKSYEIVELGISFVPQGSQIFKSLTRSGLRLNICECSFY
jgi:ABC-type branched-subunit amino acid transport system ATPase component